MYYVTVQCPDPAPVVAGTSSSVVNGRFQSDTATYTCQAGYFTDEAGVTTSTATCQATGLWSAPTPTCLSKCYFHDSLGPYWLFGGHDVQ